MNNNQKRIINNFFDCLKQDKAISILSFSVLLSSFILLFTACEAPQTTTTPTNPDADTTVKAPQADIELRRASIP